MCLLLVTCWSSKWRGGFTWDGSALHFNWHPVLMASGSVFLYGNAVVVYQVPFTWKQRKCIWKLVHAGLMLLALLLSILGLCAVFDSHRGLKIRDLSSIHSWVAISAVIMFAFQWISGLAGFLFSCSPLWIRNTLKPVHVWMGKAIVLSLTSYISDINEKLLLSLNINSGEPYNPLPVEVVFAHFLSILIVTFGSVIFGILSINK
ncbi:cytochrome b ascorbate-dependent protein 3-like [Sphaeramia orbicularis]|uniref:cytochrome b ascorbate-dependent protein 3-like n=1 Tax=Sphaeramia orbicularis TaxID=375764 RepID=UPI00117E34D1|nr:cytochrome b ascorbate-dependent protein 3-like [Sphaeramia orbicularis]